MVGSQELQVQQKRELEKKTEGTTPARVYVPVTDIFETPDALTERRTGMAIALKRQQMWSPCALSCVANHGPATAARHPDTENLATFPSYSLRSFRRA
jgi:hypothetical protein